jgi:hypothetical protein
MSKLFTFVVIGLTFALIMGSFQFALSTFNNVEFGNMTANTTIFTGINSPLGAVDSNGVITNNISGVPQQDTSVSTGTGFFIDMFNAIQNWFYDSTVGRVIYSTIYYPPQIINLLLPDPIGVSVGAFWILLGILAMVAWVFGRD